MFLKGPWISPSPEHFPPPPIWQFYKAYVGLETYLPGLFWVLRNANKDAGIKRGWSALKMKGLTKSQGANGPARTGILMGLKGHYAYW